MANLIASPQRVRGARRGRRATERFARKLRRERRGRPSGTGGAGATMAALLVAGGIGALAEYFLDRRHGAGRRHIERDRTRAALRRRSRDAVRHAKYLEGGAE